MEARSSYAPVVGITRMAAAYSYAAAGIVDRIDTFPTSLPVTAICRLMRSTSVNNIVEGIFLSRKLKRWKTYWPLSVRKIRLCPTSGVRVLSSKALRVAYGCEAWIASWRSVLHWEFATVWDGFDLFQIFTREVSIAL